MQGMFDIVLLHPPPILFPEPYPIFPIPWCPEFIGSTDDLDLFPMPERFTAMPAGLHGLKSYLAAQGRRTEVLNLAQVSRRVYAQIRAQVQPVSGPVDSMLEAWEEAYRAVKSLIQGFPARLYGIDLQWLVYVAGFSELCRMVKQIHPGSKIVAGGITAGMYGEELLSQVPALDFVIRGDAYGSLPALYERILRGDGYDRIAGLVYRHRGVLCRTSLSLSCVPEKSRVQDARCDAARESSVVFLRSKCPMDCVTCGGRKQVGGDPAGRELEGLSSLQRQILAVGDRAGVPGEQTSRVYLVHDPVFTVGEDRFESLLRGLSEAGFSRPLGLEFFRPPPRRLLSNLEETFPTSTLQISPESSSEDLRKVQRGTSYSNDELETFIRFVKESSGLTLRCWFMLGIPWDTPDTMKQTAQDVADLYRGNGEAARRIHYLCTPMTQVDPGSPAFVDPNRFGYRLLWTGLGEAEFRMSHPHPFARWNFVPSSENSSSSFFRNVLDVLDLMNRIYARYGLCSQQWTRRACRYNDLLRQSWESYQRLGGIRSALERRKACMQLGRELIESYYG